MQWQDLVNGMFESGSGLILIMNIVRLLKDKAIRGVYIWPTFVFTMWGYWNMYYYTHLAQPLSFYGGLIVASCNTIWIILAIKYRKN